MTIILAACSNNPGVVTQSTQPVSPTQTSAQQLQTPQTQIPAEPSQVFKTQAPADTQAANPTATTAGYTLTSVCSLVSKEEAAANLGTPVKDPVEQNYPPVFSCRYEDTEGIYFLDVTVVEFNNAEEAAGVFQMAIDLNNYPLVSGIGDRAYQSEIYDITAQKGKYELSISVVSSEDKETRREKAKQLAVLALERLP